MRQHGVIRWAFALIAVALCWMAGPSVCSAAIHKTTYTYKEEAAPPDDIFWKTRPDAPHTGDILVTGREDFLDRDIVDGSRRCQVFFALSGYRFHSVHAVYARAQPENENPQVKLTISRRGDKVRACYFPSIWHPGLWKKISLGWERRP